MGYTTSSVRAVPLATKEGEPFVEATGENAISGKFPLSRYLYVYVNKAPNKPLSPLEGEFLKLVLSKQGQEVVVKDGYVPLPKQVVDRIHNTLGI
jgi:phosphate transport system substrate-binding protein